MRAPWLLTVLSTAALALAPSAYAAAGDAIVLDNGGTLFAVNPLTGAHAPITSGGLLGGDDFGVAREPGGSYVVVARRGTTTVPNADPSRVVRVNPTTGAQSLIAADPRFSYGVIAVAVAPAGDIYVADEFVPDQNNLDGGIYRVDPASGAVTLVTTNSRSAAAGGAHHLDGPLGLLVDPSGTLWALDDIAGDETAPETPSDFTGAVMRVDTATGRMTVLSSNAISAGAGGGRLFIDPRAFTRAPNGDFFVVDDAAINNPGQHSAADARVIRVNGSTGAQTLVSDNARSAAAGAPGLFNRPYGIAVEPDGRLLVTDGDRLLRVDPATGRQSVVSTGLGNGIALTMEPGTPAGGGGSTPGGGGGGSTPGGGSGSTPIGGGGGGSTPIGSGGSTPIGSGGSTPIGGGGGGGGGTTPTPTLQSRLNAIVRALVADTRRARNGRVRLGAIDAGTLPDGAVLSFRLGSFASGRVTPSAGSSVTAALTLKDAGRRRLRSGRRISEKLVVTMTLRDGTVVTARRTLRVVAA